MGKVKRIVRASQVLESKGGRSALIEHPAFSDSQTSPYTVAIDASWSTLRGEVTLVCEFLTTFFFLSLLFFFYSKFVLVLQNSRVYSSFYYHFKFDFYFFYC
jgi:hypothetical protein